MRSIVEDHGYDLISAGGRPTYTVADWRRDLRRQELLRLAVHAALAAFLIFVIVVAALILL
jgi:hypothetical protein